MKNVFVWDVTPCGSSKNQRFGGTYRLHHQGEKNQRARNNIRSFPQLLDTTNVSCSLIILTLMMGAKNSSKTSVLTRARRRNIPEDAILLHLRSSAHLSPSEPYTSYTYPIGVWHPVVAMFKAVRALSVLAKLNLNLAETCEFQWTHYCTH
jgi:hypothetical protein